MQLAAVSLSEPRKLLRDELFKAAKRVKPTTPAAISRTSQERNLDAFSATLTHNSAA